MSSDNILSVNWKLSSAQSWNCNDTHVKLNLTRKTCANSDECEEFEDALRIHSLDRRFTFNNKLIACEDYEFKIMEYLTDLTINETIFTANIEYGQIVNLEISQFNDTSIPVDFVWEYDSFPACPRMFDVKVVGPTNKIERNGITDLNVTINDLEPCENYTFTVYPTNAEYLAVNKTYKLNFMIPSVVTNLATKYIQDDILPSIEVTWGEPVENAKCVIGYFIEIHNENGNPHRDRNTTNPYVQISNVYACTNYVIKVSARSANLDSAAVEIEMLIPSRVFKKPILNSENITSTSAALNATVNRESEWNFCEIDEYLFSCGDDSVSSADNIIYLTELNPYTEYNCTVKVRNRAGENETSEFSSDSDISTIITKEGSMKKISILKNELEY